MKRLMIASSFAIFIALPGSAIAQSRDDIMDKVIWPCVDDAVQSLDLQEHQLDAAQTIVFELNRDYYEEIIDAVEESLRQNTDDDAAWSYEAGLAICIDNQVGWMEQ